MTAMSAGPSRRQVLRSGVGALGALALGGSALAGCSPGTSDGRVELQFWHLLSGGDGIKMAGLIDAANAASDRYVVDPTVLAWGTPYYTKLAMAAAGGRAPDLAIIHADRVPGYAPGGLLDPWDIDELATLGVSEEQFPGPVWEGGLSEGRLFSVALDVHPFILMYNTEICEQAGVLDGAGSLGEISSPEEFLEVSRAVAAVTASHGPSYGYLGDAGQMWRLFYGLYRQQGAEMVLIPGESAQVEVDAAVTALQTVISAYGVVYSQQMAQAVLAALPLILVFLVFQRQIIKGVATSGFGGQ